jgi:hypothetical protein
LAEDNSGILIKVSYDNGLILILHFSFSESISLNLTRISKTVFFQIFDLSKWIVLLAVSPVLAKTT